VPAELFVDTSGWYPLADASNPAHDKVSRSLRDAIAARRRIVTTNLVVAETHALIMRRIHRSAALAFLREVSRAPNVVVSSTPEDEARAQSEWLERYADKDLSLTDAVSFVVMSERGIREALALDQHFAAAGFTVVPGAGTGASRRSR
jgi:predicted nucleic acid-binding protein